MIERTAENIGNTPALHVHLIRTELTSPEFPIRPYVQTPHLGLTSQPGPGGASAGVKPGTLVIPIHPNLVQNRYLRGMSISYHEEMARADP